VSSKSLPLLLQSSRDALAEGLADLERALGHLEEVEGRGQRPPVRVSLVERARAQVLSAHRILEDLAVRLG
jgi:hypothetical protein